MNLVPKKLIWMLASASWACLGVGAPAADDASAKPTVTYQDDLTAVFRESCFGCHNADKAKGGLNLATFSSLMAGGSSGTAIEPGDPDNSYLYQLVTHQSEPHMPLNSPKLPEAKLAIIRRFIEDGALERVGSKPQAKTEHAELKLSSVPTAQPDGPPPMPPRLPLEPVLHTQRTTAITALAVSPWAPLAAVAGQQQVLLYNTDNFQLLGVLPFPEGVPHVLRFSRSGKLLLAGGGQEAKSGRVVLWETRDGNRRRVRCRSGSRHQP
jgi:mono/diheme cytochrome c family protein